MKKLLTIAIPSYNVEKTLGETIKSLLINSEDLQKLLEIIVVNDGSTDNTYSIGKYYETLYPDTVILFDKENGGHGSTINAAIKIANGKYFRVVDGDDWMDTANLDRLLQFLKDNDVDIVGNDYYRIVDGTDIRSQIKVSGLENGKVYSFSEIYDKYDFSMHAVTVKTELLRDPKLTLDENCFYVDVEYDTYLVTYAKTVVYLNFPVYMYRVGQLQQSVSADGWWKHRNNHATVVKSLIQHYLDFMSTNPNEKEKIAFIKKKVKRSYIGHFAIIRYFDAKQRQVYKLELKGFDLSIKDMYGSAVYNMIGDNCLVKALRTTNFNSIPISVGRGLFLVKEKIKTVMRRA